MFGGIVPDSLPCCLVDSIPLAEREGFEPAVPRSLAPRGCCVSRDATVPGAGPLPGFLRLNAKQLAASPRKPRTPPALLIPLQLRPLWDRFEEIPWRRERDSNLPSLEASHPEGAAFQGTLLFPGRVPFRAFYGSTPSSWRHRLESHGHPPPFSSLSNYVLCGIASKRFPGGERGIRTPEPLRVNGFRDRRLRPLGHLSARRERYRTFTGPARFGAGAQGGVRGRECANSTREWRGHWRANAIHWPRS